MDAQVCLLWHFPLLFRVHPWCPQYILLSFSIDFIFYLQGRHPSAFITFISSPILELTFHYSHGLSLVPLTHSQYSWHFFSQGNPIASWVSSRNSTSVPLEHLLFLSLVEPSMCHQHLFPQGTSRMPACCIPSSSLLGGAHRVQLPLAACQ